VVEFIGYVALGSSQTKFIVYSRGHFQVQVESERWISEAVARFPELEGRLETYDLPGTWGTQSFLDPVTGEQVRKLVASILRIE